MAQDMEVDTMARPERVSSRLIKKERSKILKQTLWAVIGGVALVAAFIFLVLPTFINTVNSVLNTNPINEEGAVIIQAPDLVAPVTATYSGQLAISGVGTTGTKTVVVVNGNPATELDNSDDGTFSTTIELTEGENSLTAYSVDDRGNESKTGRTYIIVKDTQTPSLEVTEPQEGQQYESKQTVINVVGKTEPNTKIYLNNRFFLPKADGSFSTSFSLNGGENILKIKAIDAAGNQVEVERKVTRK